MRKTTKMVAVLAAMSVMVLGAATMVSADEKNGWAKEGSDWYYYVEDKAVVNQWALSGSDWYFLGDEGKMVKEKFVGHDSKNKEVVAADDIVDGDEYYYVGKDGSMLTGWVELELTSNKKPYDDNGKTWFFLGSDGVLYTDAWVLSNNLWYYLDVDGQMVEHDFEGEYYLGKDGAMITGWYKAADADVDNGNFVKDAWVYAGTNGKPVEKDWKKVDGNWYFFGSVSGGSTTTAYVMNEDTIISQVVDGATEDFYLKASGAMATGWIKDSKDVYFYADTKNGVLAKDEVKKISGKNYYFDGLESVDEGYLVTEADGKTIVDGTVYAKEADVVATAGQKIYKLGTATVKTAE